MNVYIVCAMFDCPNGYRRSALFAFADKGDAEQYIARATPYLKPLDIGLEIETLPVHGTRELQ